MKLNVWVTKRNYRGEIAWSLNSWHDECNYVYICDTVEEAEARYVADHPYESLGFNFIHKF